MSSLRIPFFAQLATRVRSTWQRSSALGNADE